jgi:hypothetical protein
MYSGAKGFKFKGTFPKKWDGGSFAGVPLPADLLLLILGVLSGLPSLLEDLPSCLYIEGTLITSLFQFKPRGFVTVCITGEM